MIDAPLLEDLFPIGKKLSEIYWESHNQRIRLPSNLEDSHQDVKIHGSAGITFGRQIGAYPILVGVPYQIPLETYSDILVTNHGKRSITGIEVGLDINEVTQKQLEALPGIGEKTAWKLISERAKIIRKNPDDIAFDGVEDAFDLINADIPEHATTVFG